MIRLNRKLEYAVIALKHMKGKSPGQLTSAKEICDMYGTPFDATARVLQVMTQKSILKSEQGAHGGYLIIKDLRKISLFDLMQTILGRLEMAKCLQGSGHCELEHSCNIKGSVSFLKTRLLEFYKNISLWELLDPNHHAQPLETSAVQAASAAALREAEGII